MEWAHIDADYIIQVHMTTWVAFSSRETYSNANKVLVSLTISTFQWRENFKVRDLSKSVGQMNFSLEKAAEQDNQLEWPLWIKKNKLFDVQELGTFLCQLSKWLEPFTETRGCF